MAGITLLTLGFCLMNAFTFSIMRFAFYWAIFLSIGPSYAQETIPQIVGPGKTFDRNLFGFQQDLIIEGEINADSTCINGNVYVHGVVNGSISVFNGYVRLGPNASMQGDIVCIKGGVSIDKDAQFDGKTIIFFGPTSGQTSALFATPKAKAAGYFGQTLFLFVLVIISFYLFPNQVSEASFELSQGYLQPSIIGFISIAFGFSSLFLSFLLMAIAIGFPLFLILFCGFAVITIFGTVVVFFRLAQYLEAWTRHKVPLVYCIVFVIALAGILIHIPIIGGTVVLLFLIFGTGIVIHTRFGTNKQWFTKKSRYWSAD